MKAQLGIASAMAAAAAILPSPLALALPERQKHRRLAGLLERHPSG